MSQYCHNIKEGGYSWKNQILDIIALVYTAGNLFPQMKRWSDIFTRVRFYQIPPSTQKRSKPLYVFRKYENKSKLRSYSKFPFLGTLEIISWKSFFLIYLEKGPNI